MSLIIIGIPLFILIVLTYTKIDFLQSRKDKIKFKAKVIAYKWNHERIKRNHYEIVRYPYVRIIDSEFESLKLNYGNRFFYTLKIGETIDVFWNNNKLMYWNSFEKGIFKLLPNQWNVFKS